MATRKITKAVTKSVTSKNVSAKGEISKTDSSTKTIKTVFRSDVMQTAALVKLGRNAGANAIRASKALDLPITYMQNGEIIKEFSDGTKEIISPSPAKKATSKKTINALKKGMVLHEKR